MFKDILKRKLAELSTDEFERVYKLLRKIGGTKQQIAILEQEKIKRTNT